MKPWPGWILGLLLIFTEGKAMNGYQFLGDVTYIEQEKNGVLLHCGPDRLRIQFLTDDIVRITLARNGQWYDGPEYAIARTDWPGADVQFEDGDEVLSLRSRTLQVRIRKQPCRLQFLDAQGRVLDEDDPAFGIGWDGDEVAVFKRLHGDERFWGLGEKVDHLDRRGREYVMWNADTPGYSYRTDPLYQSHPFFITQRNGSAFGIFFNNTYRSAFNMGAGNHRLYYFRAEKGPMDYFFFAGPTVKAVIQQYSELVGRMPLPPLWALGYQQCRWSYFPESEVMQLARTFRDKRIPADVIYLDIHYMDEYRVFTFDPKRFPDPRRMLQQLGEMGFKVVTIIDPGVKVDPGYWVYESGVKGDHFIKFPDGERYIGDVWPGKSHFANFTRPETRRWWGDLHKDFLDMGIAGFWNDMNEPSVWGKEAPLLVQFDEGDRKVTIKKIHNVFGHLMDQATFEGFRRHKPDARPFILTRAGFSGTQRYAASWTGDNISTFEHLNIAIRLCQSMGLSGIPFVGADVGGFERTPSPELFARWIQVGAFTPLFRTHTILNTPDQEPWSFGERVEAIARRYIELRYRLLPYTYTAFWQAAQTGLPIMRPLLLEFPDEPEVYNRANHTTYLWGEKMLVAPVTTPGHSVRKLYLPRGDWYSFWDNTAFEGGRYHYVDAPLEMLPLFVRGGSVLPMREVQQYVDEKPLTELELRVYPGEGESELYEDDGHSMAYERGEWCLTRFSVRSDDRELRLTIGAREGRYRPHARDFKLVLCGIESPPDALRLDGRALTAKDWQYGPEQKTVTLTFADDGRRHEIECRW